jgi:hypothetical protein
MARLVGDQLQEDQPKLASLKHPPAPAWPAAAAATLAEFEMKAPGTKAETSRAAAHGKTPAFPALFAAIPMPMHIILL